MMRTFNIGAPVTPLGTDYDIGSVRKVKAALNHLGYYKPDRYNGIEDERDKAMFVALRRFQKDHGLQKSDYVMPRDATIQKLNAKIREIDPLERYIWRTAEDARVRDEHMTREGHIFTWVNPPEGGHPGEDFNCRCWAEVVVMKKKDKCQDKEISWINAQGKLKVSEDAIKKANSEKERLEKELEHLVTQLDKEKNLIDGDKGTARNIGAGIGIAGSAIIAGLPGAAAGLSAGSNIGTLIEEGLDIITNQKTDMQLKLEIKDKKNSIIALVENILNVLRPAFILAKSDADKAKKAYSECIAGFAKG